MKTIAQLLEKVDYSLILNKKNKTKNGTIIYEQFSDNSWKKFKYDKNDNIIPGVTTKLIKLPVYVPEKNTKNIIKIKIMENQKTNKDSTGKWLKKEYDNKNNCIYVEDSDLRIQKVFGKNMNMMRMII